VVVVVMLLLLTLLTLLAVLTHHHLSYLTCIPSDRSGAACSFQTAK
jgi:hypothetical protein